VKSAAFEYTRARSIEEARELLARHASDAKLLAGGQSLVPMMAMRLLRPGWLVDINEIDALKFIAIGTQEARTGACTRQVVLERDDALAANVPLLRMALACVGHVQTRNRGTVGGSLAQADPSAELPLVAIVLGARVGLGSAAGNRELEAREFVTGAMSTAARADECLEEIRWPVWRERRVGAAFEEVSIRHGDFALVAGAAQVALDEQGCCTRASFGLAGVGTTAVAFPKLAERLVGTRLDDPSIEEAAHAAAKGIQPGSDLHASSEYRRHLARILVARTLRASRAKALAA
jgi:CO/xanthine dehydrogenase FAD-binding subunit